MGRKKATLGLILAVLTSACATPPPPSEKGMEWEPSRIAISPTIDGAARVQTPRSRPPLGKFSLQFYQELKARPVVAPLAEVDVWELRHHPRQVGIITIEPVPFRQYSGRKELLDHLATTHGLTKEKAEALTNWVKTGGVIWIEFGVFIQGHEWILNDARRLPPLPDLREFTILGLPTHPFVFEAKRRGAFAIEPAVFSFQNEAKHAATADIKMLRLRQSHLKTIYPIINADQGEALIREGEQVYATMVGLGQGKIITTLPFDEWDAETDGEKYRINLFEWLAGYPIPSFAPTLHPDHQGD